MTAHAQMVEITSSGGKEGEDITHHTEDGAALSDYKDGCGVKKIGVPRVGKKLAVLGLEDLLCDVNQRIGRPFVHVFLAKLYKHYDIALWSDRQMAELELMVDILGMDKHPRYKLLCYVDKTEIMSLSLPTRTVLVKPLEVIWKEYSNYDKKNTVICDSRQDRIVWNFENGIVAHRYSYDNCDADEELLTLWSYMKSIADCRNVSMLDHGIWKYKIRHAKKCNCCLL